VKRADARLTGRTRIRGEKPLKYLPANGIFASGVAILTSETAIFNRKIAITGFEIAISCLEITISCFAIAISCFATAILYLVIALESFEIVISVFAIAISKHEIAIAKPSHKRKIAAPNETADSARRQRRAAQTITDKGGAVRRVRCRALVRRALRQPCAGTPGYCCVISNE
jgi:hypothetical protein